ncbi:hypothetical protein CCYA_CCYA07G2030 [Cyanidiococcus yangmingshanensis]|nr:hypothetical protein CCYA_CCYA07G2030 [Cyanidiococcus yangmingshanensis]
MAQERISPIMVSEAQEWDEAIIMKPSAETRRHGPMVGLSAGDLPAYMKPAFQHIDRFNQLQSKVLDRALRTRGNILVCAPTGSGKTEIAMALILQSLFEECNGDLQDFKCVYIAPMRALVAELQRSLSSRLRDHGLLVSECTGERRLSHSDLWRSHILVTTPEKWDVITRHPDERPLFRFLKIVILDEIHVLGDPKRGPVLERCVARLHHEAALFRSRIRLVGLSATLPNYDDVAVFLRAKLDEGVFAYTEDERPCPLEVRTVALRHRIGLLSRARLDQIMNQAIWFQVRNFAIEKKEQVLVFVHERNDTMKTARWLLSAAEVEHLSLCSDSRIEATHPEIVNLLNEHPDILALISRGVGIHHAGLTREIRHSVEEAFSRGSLRVVISTATLAWGVNLPASVVVIKGTQYYSAEEGKYVQLSPLNVQQMLGRAGRYPFHHSGTGIIITTQPEVRSYASIISNRSLIESHHVPHLADSLLAEVAGGSVHDVEEAAEWLKYTFFFIRALRSKSLYGLSLLKDADDDGSLRGLRLRLCHSAAKELAHHSLISYTESFEMESTARGNVASAFMLPYESIAAMGTSLRSAAGPPDILHIVATSTSEMRNLSIPRGAESKELGSLLQRVPIPLMDTERDLKISVLLQAYISGIDLNTLPSLSQDAVVIVEHAARVFRALHALAAVLGLAIPMRNSLFLAKCLQNRRWVSSQTRQLGTFCARIDPSEQKLQTCLQKESIMRDRPAPVSCSALGREGPKGHSWIGLESSLVPVSEDMFRLECVIYLLERVCIRTGEAVWVTLEDASGEKLLFSERVILKHDPCHLVALCKIPLAVRTALAYWRISAEESIVEDCVKAECLRDLCWPRNENFSEQECVTYLFRDVDHIRTACETLLPRIFRSIFVDKSAKRPGLLLSIPILCDHATFISTSLDEPGQGMLICYASPHRWHRIEFAISMQSRSTIVHELCEDPRKNACYVQALTELVGTRAVIGTPKQFELLTNLVPCEKLRSALFLWVFDDIESLSWEPQYEFLLMKLAGARQILVSEFFGNLKQTGHWLGISPSRILRLDLLKPEKRSFRLVSLSSRLVAQPRLVAKRFWRQYYRTAPAQGHVAVCCVMRGSLPVATELARQSPFSFTVTHAVGESIPMVVRACLERGVLLLPWHSGISKDLMSACPVRVVVVQLGDELLSQWTRECSLAFVVGNGLENPPARWKENIFLWSCRYLSRFCSGDTIVLVPQNLCSLFREAPEWVPFVDSVADQSWDSFVATQVAQGLVRTNTDIFDLVNRSFFHQCYLRHDGRNHAQEVLQLRNDLERIAIFSSLLTNKLVNDMEAIRVAKDDASVYEATAIADLSNSFGISLQTAQTLHNIFSFEEPMTKEAFLENLSELLSTENDQLDVLGDFASGDIRFLNQSTGGNKDLRYNASTGHALRASVIYGLLQCFTECEPAVRTKFWVQRLVENLYSSWFRTLPAVIHVGLTRLTWSKFQVLLAMIQKLSGVFLNFSRVHRIEKNEDHLREKVLTSVTASTACEESERPELAASENVDGIATSQRSSTRTCPRRYGSIHVLRAVFCREDRSLKLVVFCATRVFEKPNENKSIESIDGLRSCWIVVQDTESDTIVGAERVFLHHGQQEANLHLDEIPGKQFVSLRAHVFDEIYADDGIDCSVSSSIDGPFVDASK